MKKALFLLLVCVIFSLGGAPAGFSPTPVSLRKLQLSKTSTTFLIRKGKVQMGVYVPGDAPQKTGQAAAEFASFLSRIAGKEKSVPLFTKVPSDFQGTLFCVGDKRLASRLKVDLKSLDRDGFVIQSAGNKILIAGGDALDSEGDGTLWGCYEFLERFGGVRFYFPGEMGTIVPVKRDWALPQITLYDRPDSIYRRIYWPGIHGVKPVWHDPATDREWRKALSLHEKRMRQSTLFLPNCHGLAHLGYVKRFAKSHPEYFALKADGKRCDGSVVKVSYDAPGQLCFSSNIMEEIYQDAKAILTGDKAIAQRKMTGYSKWAHAKPFFNLMPNDAMERCRCSRCAPHFKELIEGKRYSRKGADFLWSKLLTIPKRLQKEKVPGFVTMMAYDLCKEPPKEKIPANVIIQVAVNGPWSKGRPGEKEELDLIKRWIKAYGSAKIYMWNYPTKCAVKELPLIPNHTPECIGEYYKKMYPYSFGTMLNATSDHWFFGHLNFYVFSKVMWDHKTDVNALLKEYFSLMFGKGGSTMEKISRRLEELWLKKICGNTVETSYGPVSFPPDEIKLWNEIFSAQEVAFIETLFDSAIKEAGNDKSAVSRIRHWKKYMWSPTAEGRARYFNNRGVIDRFTVPVIPVRGQEPLWGKEIPRVALVPLKGDAAEVQTFVQMRCDKENFYFRFECEEPQTARMAARVRPFEDRKIWQDNGVEIHIDTEGKRHSGYQLIVNSCGSVGDLSITPAKFGENWSWNSGAKAKVTVNKNKNWIAEITLPRKNMVPVKKGRFHINFSRHRNLEAKGGVLLYTWSPFVKSFADLNNFGTAVIAPAPSKNLFSDPDFVYTGIPRSKEHKWYGALPVRDTKVFRTAGVSMRFEGKKNALIHKVPLKPDTWYRLGFFLKMENVKLLPGIRVTNGGFYLRVDEGGKAHYFPKFAYYGSMPWLYLEHTWRTGAKVGRSYSPYIHFTLRNVTGKAWVDHVELTEIADK